MARVGIHQGYYSPAILWRFLCLIAQNFLHLEVIQLSYFQIMKIFSMYWNVSKSDGYIRTQCLHTSFSFLNTNIVHYYELKEYADKKSSGAFVFEGDETFWENEKMLGCNWHFLHFPKCLEKPF